MFLSPSPPPKLLEPAMRIICVLGQQGFCIYGQDKRGRLWYCFSFEEEWRLVAY